MNIQQSKVQKKQIRIYRNANRNYLSNEDDHAQGKKVAKNPPNLGDAYDIVESENLQVKASPTHQQTGKYRCTWSKAPS